MRWRTPRTTRTRSPPRTTSRWRRLPRRTRPPRSPSLRPRHPQGPWPRPRPCPCPRPWPKPRPRPTPRQPPSPSPCRWQPPSPSPCRWQPPSPSPCRWQPPSPSPNHVQTTSIRTACSAQCWPPSAGPPPASPGSPWRRPASGCSASRWPGGARSRPGGWIRASRNSCPRPRGRPPTQRSTPRSTRTDPPRSPTADRCPRTSGGGHLCTSRRGCLRRTAPRGAVRGTDRPNGGPRRCQVNGGTCRHRPTWPTDSRGRPPTSPHSPLPAPARSSPPCSSSCVRHRVRTCPTPAGTPATTMRRLPTTQAG